MKDHNLNFKAAAPKGGGFFVGSRVKILGKSVVIEKKSVSLRAMFN